jgi:hypothetical protein
LATVALTDPRGRRSGRIPCSQDELLRACGKLTQYRSQRYLQ